MHGLKIAKEEVILALLLFFVVIEKLKYIKI